MEKTFTLTAEYCISVSDYLKPTEFNSPFKVQQAMKTIEEKPPAEISAHIKKSLLRLGHQELAEKLIISDCMFLEFDSTNPYHAVGYFEFTITGPKALRELTTKVIFDGLPIIT